ncbi:hypothetical protein V1477_017835, partial [Vespula maculifrons]
PRRTGPGSLERARRALYAHIFFVQIEPIGAENKGKKHFPLTIFFSETVPPRRTWPGSLERTRRALYAHIFFFQIGPIGADTQENRSWVIGKGSSRPLRPYFFRPDRTNRSRVITENLTGVIGKGSSRPLRPYFFRPDRTNRSRVITEPSYNGLKVTKEKKHFSLTIFFSETIAPRRTGLGSLERARRALYAHIFFVQIRPIGAKVQRRKTLYLTIFFSETDPGEPVWGRWKGLVAPCTHIFFSSRSDQQEPSYNGLKGTMEKNIHLGEPDRAPRRTGLGSLKRARRALYAHIFFVKIGPIGAKTQENRSGVIGKGSPRPVRTYFFRPDRTNRSRVITEILTGVIVKGSSRPLRPYFFRPDRTNRSRVITEPSYNGLKVTKEKKHFSLTIFFSETIAPRRTGLGSLERARRALYAHIFFVQIGPIGAKVQRRKTLYLTIFFSETENLTGVIGKDSSRPLRPYFFRPDRTNRSQVITDPGEPVRGHWKGLVAPSTSIFFFFQIGPIGAETQENRSGVIGKGSPRPVRTYFFRPDRTNRSRVITHPGEPMCGHWKGLVTPSQRRTGLGSLERTRRALYAHIFFFQIGPIGADTQENRSWVIGKGSSRPVRTYFFRPDRTNRSQVITENLTGVTGKDSSRPLRPYFFLPDRTNRSRVITHPGEPVWGHWKGLVGPCTHIFFSSRSDQQEPSYNGLKGTKEKNIHPGEPMCGHWKGLVAPSTPIFFSSRSDQQEPSYNGLKGTMEKNIIGPIGVDTQENRTGVVGKDSSRPLRPYFFRPDRTNRSRVITEPSYNGLKVTKEKKHFSLTIFFSETIAPTRTGLGSLERARRALYAHIFFVQIGPIGADTQENRTGVVGKGSSRPLRPYFFRPDRTNRSRVITEPSYNGLKVTKEKKHFSLTIFFSETIAPRRTGLGSLERARRALYAHIFFVQIGPIGADTQENRSWVIGKGSSRPVRTYFFRPDQTNRSQVITEPSYNGLKVTKQKKLFSLTIFFSETIGPRRSGPGSLERTRRALYAHIFFLPDWTNRSRVITDPGEPVWGRWKGLVAPCTHIFFSSRSDQQEPSYNGLKGTMEKNIEPSYNGLKVTKEKKHFSLTIFFSETIAPRRTGLGSLKRARRALYAHIFFVKIGPIGAKTQENRSGVIGKGSPRPVRTYFFRPDRTNRSRVITEILTGVIVKGSSRPLRPYFFRPDRTNRSRVITEPSYNGLKVTKEKKHFSLTIFFSETIAPRRTGLGSLERARRALYAHIFFVQIGPIGAKVQRRKTLYLTIFFSETENLTGVIGKDSSRPLRPYFFRPDRTNRSQVITDPGEPVRGHWKGLVAPSTSIFFFFQIRPIGAETQENRSGVIGKGSPRPVRTYFFRPDRTNRSRVITHPGEPMCGHWKGLVTPSQRRTGLGSLERTRRALYAHIFFVQIGPIGAENKGKKHFPLTIFFSETVAPRRTRLWSLERTRRALYAHIFFFQIGPIGADTQENRSWVIGKGSSRPVRTYFFRPDRTNRSQVITENLTGVIGKDSSRPLRPYFFLPDRTNRSRVITHPGEPVWGHWKGLVGPCTHIFFSSRSDQQEPSYNGLKGTKEKNIHLGEPDRGRWKGLVAPSTPIFFSSRSDQ